MATLKDIASKTGVSIGTVSRVLNYDQSLTISDEKKRLIMKTADELNYKTLQERKLEEGKILILQTSTKKYELQDPYFMSIKTGAENYAKNKRVNYQSEYLEDIKIADLKNYLGVIIIGLLDQNDVEHAYEVNKNIVFVENNPMTGNYNSVNVDLAKMSREVAKYYSDNGRKLMYFGPLSNDSSYDIRQEAFKSSANYYGLEYDQVHTSMDVIDSYAQAIKYFSNNSDKLSVLSANDNVAIGVLRACNELGISVPEQVEIIGINNIPASEFTEPALSTISIPSEFMGEYAIRVLLDKIEHNVKIPINHVVSTELIERGTTIRKD